MSMGLFFYSKHLKISLNLTKNPLFLAFRLKKSYNIYNVLILLFLRRHIS